VESVARAELAPVAARSNGLEVELRELNWRIEELASEKAAFETAAERIPELDAKVNRLQLVVDGLNIENARLKTELNAQNDSHAKQLEALTAVREEIDKNMKLIAASSLRDNQQGFLKLANETFEKHKQGADAELEARKVAVEGLIKPLNESFKAYQEQIDKIEADRKVTEGRLQRS
jgi:DNA recombination protein RmuC